MRYRLKDIAISDIDIQDESYRISTPANIDGLVASIRQVGLLNPPALKAKQDHYTIIYGFKRIEAARRVGVEKIPARLLPEDAALSDCVCLAISDNLVHRDLNLVEVSRCLTMLSRCISDPALVSTEARRLGLAGNDRYFHEVAQIEMYSEAVKNGLSEGRLSQNIAKELQGFGPDCADQLATLFCVLRINQNKQRQICTHLKEIAIRDSQTVRSVMNDLGFEDILAQPSMSNQQKTESIRLQLRQRRFPHLWEAQKRSSHALRNLKLDKTIQIQPPDYFEDTSFTLQFTFKNKIEFRQHIARLEKILANSSLDLLLKR